MVSVHKGVVSLVVPNYILGPVTGCDKTNDNRFNMLSVSAIRIAIALGIYKVVDKYKADPKRVSVLGGGLLSAPAAGVYWSGKMLQMGASELKKAFLDRNPKSFFWGSSYWVGGCIVGQIALAPNYNGYRWGAVEYLMHPLCKDESYMGWKGF